MAATLSPGDKRLLLRLARAAVAATVHGRPLPTVEAGQAAPSLTCPGSCFVTLLCQGELRGCIGGLAAERPLVEDVLLRAAQSARSDYRFLPVTPDELPALELEISVLTEPKPLPYASAADLLRRLRPGVDGVILQYGRQRATFLPQVWERVPDPAEFLALLCEKLGARPDTWRRQRLEVWVYQVDKFAESEFDAEPGRDDAVPRGAP